MLRDSTEWNTVFCVLHIAHMLSAFVIKHIWLQSTNTKRVVRHQRTNVLQNTMKLLNLLTPHRLQYLLHNCFARWKSKLQISNTSHPEWASTHGAEMLIFLKKCVNGCNYYCNLKSPKNSFGTSMERNLKETYKCLNVLYQKYFPNIYCVL